MSKIQNISYIKANGDFTRRQVIVVSKPNPNYLTLDVSNLSETDQVLLTEYLVEMDNARNEVIAEFDLMTGNSYRSLWRSFKPEGIEWEKESEQGTD